MSKAHPSDVKLTDANDPNIRASVKGGTSNNFVVVGGENKLGSSQTLPVNTATLTNFVPVRLTTGDVWVDGQSAIDALEVFVQNTVPVSGTITANTTQTTFDHGSKSSITTTAVQITTTSIAANQGVLVKADKDNTDVVVVGNSDVTSSSADATDGFELSAGDFISLPINNANKVYVRAQSGTQRVTWVVV